MHRIRNSRIIGSLWDILNLQFEQSKPALRYSIPINIKVRTTYGIVGHGRGMDSMKMDVVLDSTWRHKYREHLYRGPMRRKELEVLQPTTVRWFYHHQI